MLLDSGYPPVVHLCSGMPALANRAAGNFQEISAATMHVR